MLQTIVTEDDLSLWMCCQQVLRGRHPIGADDDRASASIAQQQRFVTHLLWVIVKLNGPHRANAGTTGTIAPRNDAGSPAHAGQSLGKKNH
jgi:hypothetical protein